MTKQPEDFSPEQLDRIRAVQRRLPEQQRQLAKKRSGGKVNRKAMKDRS